MKGEEPDPKRRKGEVMKDEKGKCPTWMDESAYNFVQNTKAADGYTLAEVFRSGLWDTLRALSAELGKNLTTEDVLTVVGNDISAPGEGDEKTGKMVESYYTNWLIGKGKLDKTVSPLFVPRYIARMTQDGKIVRNNGKIVKLGNFVPVFSDSEHKWEKLAASGNPFWKGSDIYRLREVGLEKKRRDGSVKLFPALTYEDAQVQIDRSTNKHQGNMARTGDRKSLSADLMGSREHREEPDRSLRATTGYSKGKRPDRR